MRIFNFDKVADFNLVFKHGIRAQMYIRPHYNFIFNGAVVPVGKLHFHFAANFNIGKAYGRPDYAVSADFRIALQPGVRVNNGIIANFNIFADKGACRVHNGYAAVHQRTEHASAQFGFCFRQLAAAVYAHYHGVIGRNGSANFFAHAV